jgi:hypothetical protein
MAEEKAGAPRLAPLSERFVTTRLALHQVAERIVAPARKPDNEISLRATPGGFGTPVFEFGGNESQVRVDHDELVYSTGSEERRAALTSLRDAGELVAELLPDASGLPGERLEIHRDSAGALGEWYALGDAVLRDLRAAAADDDAPSETSLWPEHFDIAIELGAEGSGRRANYGFSPGDDEHPEPYLYVGPWSAKPEGELWNATGFTGAELAYSELLGTDDPRRAAVEFCLARKQVLDLIDVPR